MNIKGTVDVITKLETSTKSKELTAIANILTMLNKLNLKLNKEHFRELYNKRSPEEIMESGFVTGCTDRAILFVELAQRLGIKDIYFVETLHKKWVEAPIVENEAVYGHVFVFVGPYLVDPSKAIIYVNNKLVLQDWVFVGKKRKLAEFGFNDADTLVAGCRKFKEDYKKRNRP